MNQPDPAPPPAPARRPTPSARPRPLSPERTRAEVADAARRTLARDALAAAHGGFRAVSPAVGHLDAARLDAELRRDADAAIALLADLAVATDPVLRAQARALARRLLPRLGAAGTPRRRGTHRLVVCTGTLEGELEMDRTLERSGHQRPRRPEQLVTRRLAAAPRAVCLLVDRSGSMSGHAVALAAVAAAAVVSAASERMRCAVVAVASETMILRELDDRAAPGRVVDDLLALRGHGRTDLAAGLRAAAGQLHAAAPGGRTAILLSDCLHTKGEDPLGPAGAVDTLHVLCTSRADEARDAGRALARRGRGRLLAAGDVNELTAALRVVLGGSPSG